MPEIDLSRARCREYPDQAHLWDAEIDGNLKNAVAENARERIRRHEKAKTICRTCPEKDACYFVGFIDPTRSGIYGGVLV